MRGQRPVLVIPQSQLAQILNLGALGGIVALFVIAIHGWLTLPDTIPIHFGFDGRANGWVTKKLFGCYQLLVYSFMGC